MAQSYANSGGSGNRAGLVTVTSTVSPGVGTAAALVDGSQTNNYWWNGSQTGREVRFDFGRSRLIDEAKWYQDSANAHGTWQWQGSDDASTWTSIGATFTLGSSATQTITALSGNATFYRYYRMLQTAGSTNGNPWIREAEFSIDDAPFITDARITQAALEHWASVSAGSNLALVTQVALEHWVSLAAPITARQNAVTVICG
jgi:hypothetical protein